MREINNINQGWHFTLEPVEVPVQEMPQWQQIDLPHTWNKYDGQDGGGDYYRGIGTYAKEVHFGELKPGSEVYLQVNAATDVADVYVNGKKAVHHEGGYSIFRANITDLIHKGKNLIAIQVDNSFRDDIYPQMADFTFYGGLYRGVDIIVVPHTHFDLDFRGSSGIKVDSEVDPKSREAKINIEAWVTHPEKGDSVQFSVIDAEGNVAGQVILPAEHSVKAQMDLKDVHLWQGTVDPYLYTVKAELRRHNEILDEIAVNHGFRKIEIDPQKGFFLNEVLTPLRGVSRHQDLLDKGNALTYEDHKKDAELIRDLGANTVRLAHYQHSQDFYDLMDEMGLVAWAEIPFISKMSDNPKAHEDARSQMEELIYQNYNHPSIATWGISNEITIGGETEQLNKNLEDLNDLVHELDQTRPTTMAQVSSLPMESVQNQLSDILSYNHYFGWYGGNLEDNEKWFDKFHEKYPDRAIGISEYGCEGIVDYHNDNPSRGDYSEEYQAKYHEHMAKMIDERPWLWATHIWNMFDFGVDARDEGGVKGRNNKGLMSFDRKLKKDSYYIYKAYWSDDPFVHIAGKRYARRPGTETTIKVYSNQPEVTLIDDQGKTTELSADKVFEFKNVPLHDGINTFTVKSGDLEDVIYIEKVDELPDEYIYHLPEGSVGVTNWFDDMEEVEGPMEFKEGYYSIKDKVGDLDSENKELMKTFLNGISSTIGMNVNLGMMKMMKDSTIEELGHFNNDGDEAEKKLKMLNRELQKFKK